MKNFGLIGLAGYVAPRHLKAIKDTGNCLVAAYDLNDSVGIIDDFFPDALFFTEFERFDRHIDKIRRKGEKLDFLSVCSPNYLHDAHCRFGLRSNVDVICEKPLVLNPWNIDAIQEIENETGKRVFNILQLRLHPAIQALKETVNSGPKSKIYEVDLAYFTARGAWYRVSWKGDVRKSGGIATNIGIHFFDMLGWVFGELKTNQVHIHGDQTAAGFLEFEKAQVRWFLSIDEKYIPKISKTRRQRTYRSITVDGEELEFSFGFEELHTLSYEEILQDRGFGTEDVRKCIQLVHDIRNTKPIGRKGFYHPLLLR